MNLNDIRLVIIFIDFYFIVYSTIQNFMSGYLLQIYTNFYKF